MLRRFLAPYSVCLLIGMVIGIEVGDYVFPVIGHTFGVVLGDVLLGVGGAFLAALVYEMVVFGRAHSK